MSTKTTNYNLIKPEYTDTPDITSMNPNWDIIDTKLKEAIADLTSFVTDEELNQELGAVRNYSDEQFESLDGKIGGLDNLELKSTDLVDAINQVYLNSSGGASTLVKNTVGELSNLTTTNKTNVVAAINEIDGSIPTKVSDLENDLEFAQIDDLAGFLSNGGGALYGDIDLVGDGSAISGVIVFNNDAEANTPYIIADWPEYDPGDNARLRLGGVWDDTAVILDGIAEPREDNHAATKKYVDDKVATAASKEYLVGIFGELKTALEAMDTETAIAVLDRAILDMSTLA